MRPAIRYEVWFGETARHIREAGDARTLVLQSFYPPDTVAPADEVKQIEALADGPNVTHLAGGVHAPAEPVQTLDARYERPEGLAARVFPRAMRDSEVKHLEIRPGGVRGANAWQRRREKTAGLRVPRSTPNYYLCIRTRVPPICKAMAGR